jgi:hypothetical protein
MSIKFKDVANLYMPFLAIVDDRSYMVHGYSMDEDMFQIDIDEQTQDWWNTTTFLPVLRNLKSISIVEMKDLWLLIFKRHFHESGNTRLLDKDKPKKARLVMMSGVERLGIEFNGHIWADSDLQREDYNEHEVTRWLLIKGFDLFGLIESGEAKNGQSLTSGPTEA